jgi:adenosylcobinamide kinase/adenosylcobinamide-phosphate guanylyltransferase
MSLTLLIGGARSGKSQLAVRLSQRRGDAVVVVATAEARDDEMAERITRHRSMRPGAWETIEEPVELASALAVVEPDACTLLDCLTMWVANVMELGLPDSDIEARARAALSITTSRRGATIAVTNEVGAGIVPSSDVARRYRDLLGRVNAAWAAAADEVLLVVAGRVLPLHPPEDLDRE